MTTQSEAREPATMCHAALQELEPTTQATMLSVQESVAALARLRAYLLALEDDHCDPPCNNPTQGQTASPNQHSSSHKKAVGVRSTDLPSWDTIAFSDDLQPDLLLERRLQQVSLRRQPERSATGIKLESALHFHVPE